MWYVCLTSSKYAQFHKPFCLTCIHNSACSHKDFEEYQPEEEMQQAVETVPLPAPPPLHTAHLQPPLHNAPQTPTVTVPAPNSAWDLLNEVPRVVVLVSPQTRAIPAQPAAPIPAPLVRAVQNMPPTTTSPTTVLLQRELMQLPQQVEQVLAQIPGGNLGNVHRSQVAATAASAPVEALVLQVAELPAAAVQRPPLMNPPAVVTPQPSAPTVHAFQPQIFPLAFQGAAYTLLQDLPAPNTALPAPNTVPLPQPTRVVVLVTCNILSILQSMVNAVTDPTNFDLGGQTFRCPAGAGLYISKDQVTLTNGTFVATQASQLRGACLNIFGNDVCLEGININFFTKGVAVCVGARLKMTACELCGEGTGITVSNTGGGVNTAAGNGSLTACNVVVQGSELGMVFQDCVAHLTDCEFKATVQGMRMSGASCKVCAKGMISAGCSLGLMVRGGASAEMLRCTWMDSLVSSVDVQDQGSVVDLIDCMLDIPAMPRGEGRVLVRDQ